MDVMETSQAMNRTALTMSGRLDNLRLVGAHVRHLCKNTVFEPETGKIELCVIEAVTNAIKHGCADERDEVVVRFVVDDQRMMVEVIDHGEGVDPEFFAADNDVWDFDPEDLDSLPEGGMGLEIMREYMDEVTQEQQEDCVVLRLVRLAANIQSEMSDIQDAS